MVPSYPTNVFKPQHPGSIFAEQICKYWPSQTPLFHVSRTMHGNEGNEGSTWVKLNISYMFAVDTKHNGYEANV